MLEAAAATGVERFVNISTDKAANPISVLGYSKRITERLTAHARPGADGTYLNVRFGNVLGSRGSVLTALPGAGRRRRPDHRHRPRGDPLLHDRAGGGRSWSSRRPRSAATARRWCWTWASRYASPTSPANWPSRRPAPVEIVYTGLRPGEKLHEELFADGEQDVRPLHPLISHVTVPPLNPDRVLRIDPGVNKAELIAELGRLCQLDAVAQATPAPRTGRTKRKVTVETTIDATIDVAPTAKKVGRQFTKS